VQAEQHDDGAGDAAEHRETRHQNWPMTLAEAPSATNTSEKPRMNASDDMMTRLRTGEATATLPVPAHLVEREARDVREVAGNERQDAGRNEREQSRSKRREQRDVFDHVSIAGIRRQAD
jgi:hypothetical protein